MKYLKTNQFKDIDVYFMTSFQKTIKRVIYKSKFTTAIYCKYNSVFHRVSVSPRGVYSIHTKYN